MTTCRKVQTPLHRFVDQQIHNKLYSKLLVVNLVVDRSTTQVILIDILSLTMTCNYNVSDFMDEDDDLNVASVRTMVSATNSGVTTNPADPAGRGALWGPKIMALFSH